MNTNPSNPLAEVRHDGHVWQLRVGDSVRRWELWRSDPEHGWVCVEWYGDGDLREAAAGVADFEALLVALGARPGAGSVLYSPAILLALADALEAPLRAFPGRWSLGWLVARGHVPGVPPRATLADFLRVQALRESR